MRLCQLETESGARAVAATLDDGSALLVPNFTRIYDLAMAAIAAKRPLADLVVECCRQGGNEIDLAVAYARGRMLTPIDHEDPAHLHVTGTGLTHLGSAEGRDKMHRDVADPSKQTDSMRMFRKGLEGGKPVLGQIGVQPEWFYKGDGSIVAAPGEALVSPSFALDGGEEPEIVGLYVVAPDGTPWRVGHALGNEFSDHVMERENYLYLAHSKLRACSIGPEILLGELAPHVEGVSRILRDGQAIWEKPFLSGESNMSHALRNLEHHHFKYRRFRRPGDVHVHFFGTATLSFSDGIRAREGDVFEVSAAPFGLPLRNILAREPVSEVTVRAL